MVFSSPSFLFLFLPLVLVLYFSFGHRWKNWVLLMASLVFYTWGAGSYLWLLLASIIGNTLLGLWIQRVGEGFKARLILGLGVFCNVSALLYFKYWLLFLAGVNQILGSQFDTALAPDFPLGVSFFTFQALSYLVDVYRNPDLAEKNPLKLALYIAMFFQLLAGPIVRYHEIRSQIRDRSSSFKLAAEGVVRFSVGLAKKVLLADTLGLYADRFFTLPVEQLTISMAWLGALCFVLTVYFDFSGYSDMALGLGLVFGFRLPENFRYPYISRTVSEFWTRWHISLTAWFRDYLFFPSQELAGEKYSRLSIVGVLVLAGLWHGARWTFVFFGFIHGFLIVLEIAFLSRLLSRLPRLVGHIYCWLVIGATFVLFREATLNSAAGFLGVMFLGSSGVGGSIGWYSILPSNLLWGTLLLGVLASCPVVPWIEKRLEPASGKRWVSRALICCRVFVPIGLLIVCLMRIATQSHKPFLYFQY